jgi:hypothetical protein
MSENEFRKSNRLVSRSASMIFKAAKLFNTGGGKLLKAKFEPTIPVPPSLTTADRASRKSLK